MYIAALRKTDQNQKKLHESMTPMITQIIRMKERIAEESA